MWMAYKSYPEVTDFKSALNYLIELFVDLKFDSNHEAIYGLDRWMNMDECFELSSKYGKAGRLCVKCQKGKISRLQLCLYLKGMDFDEYIEDLKPYLTPTELTAIEEGCVQPPTTISSDEDDSD